jgi:hypothetical protein
VKYKVRFKKGEAKGLIEVEADTGREAKAQALGMLSSDAEIVEITETGSGRVVYSDITEINS